MTLVPSLPLSGRHLKRKSWILIDYIMNSVMCGIGDVVEEELRYKRGYCKDANSARGLDARSRFRILFSRMEHKVCRYHNNYHTMSGKILVHWRSYSSYVMGERTRA
jgi:hypothetical protein